MNQVNQTKQYAALIILGLTYLTRHGLWRMAIDWLVAKRERGGSVVTGSYAGAGGTSSAIRGVPMADPQEPTRGKE